MRNFMNRYQIASKKIVFAISIAATLTFIVVVGLYNHRSTASIDHSMQLQQGTILESRVLIAGDIYWGRRMNDWSQQSSLKEKYPFARLHEFQRDKYDAWVGNLECPSVPGVKHSIGFVPELREFNCDSDYMPEFAKWFSVVSLANNHTSNQKRELGQDATRQLLEQHGVQWFGGFNPHESSDVCRVVTLPARTTVNGEQEDISLPIAMCGYHGAYYTITDEAIDEISKYAQYMPVISMPHMGTEYRATADEKRETLYRSMIDHGADSVIGNHPHWVQPTEAYKGKLIAYSMGNFIFDQEFSPEVMRSVAFSITLSIKDSAISSDQLKKWVELGKLCNQDNNRCLDTASDMQLSKLPVDFTYDIVGVDTSGRMTHKANQRELDSILERLNWGDTSSNLD